MWVSLRVQFPELPSTTGNTGKYLKATGGGAYWQSLSDVTPWENATVVQAIANNTIYSGGTMTSVEITLPNVSDTTIDYISQCNFTSGVTPTSFTAPNTMKWLGDDVSSNVFVPAASKRYAIMVYFDGTYWRGIVQAVTTA